jgi:uncharacterized protein (DUF849 family)
MLTETTSFLSNNLVARPHIGKGGWGVYATRLVRQGELLACWGGAVVPWARFRELSDDLQRHSLQVEEDLFLVSVHTSDPAELVNHSCDPNAGLSGQIALVAMRDIAIDEEICFDYAMSDGSPYDEFDCSCGTARCRGRVTGNDWRLPELWVRYAGYFSPYLQRRISRLQARHYDFTTGGAMFETKIGLQATLNGDLTKAAHAAVPVSVEELARDAAACFAAGARAIHLHPRDHDGRESLDAEVVDEVVVKVRHACGVPVGVSTGAWIEPDLERRLELIRAWRAPDYASVNLSEPGATEVMQALLQAGVGIEAGVWTVEDAERLAASGLGGRVTRVLVEPVAVSAADAVGLVEEIHRALDRLGLTARRLQHGDGEATWVLLTDAIRRGLDTRIGLEDTLYEPNGERTAGNEALVRAARELGAGAH